MRFGNFRTWWSRITQRLGRWRSPVRPGAAEAAAADRQLVFGLSKSRIPTRRQLAYVSEVMSSSERLMVQWLAFVAVAAALTLIGSFLNRHIAAIPRSGGTLTEGLVGSPQFINPVLARLNSVDTEVTGLTFRGLMHMDKDFHLTPDLAEKIDVSADGKTYTITLKKNLKWSDGSKLTAQDVTYTFTTLADPAFKSPLLPIFRSVQVSTHGDRTVVFTLTQPLAPFLSYLTVGLIPEAVWLNTTPQTFSLDEFNLKPTGNGPFKFQSLTKDRDGNIKSMVFGRNENFAGHRPYLDKVNVKFYPDHASAVEALKTGAIDALGGAEVNEATTLAHSRSMKQFFVSQLTAVFFNQKSNGALKAPEVRLALSYATDRQSIVHDAVRGFGRTIVGPILPGYLGYNPVLKRYDFDLAKANDVLEKAGWKKTDSGIRQKGSQQLTFTFTVVDQAVPVAIAQALIKNWEQIGAHIELKKIDAARIQRDVLRPRSYEALLFGQIFNTDPDPYPFWHSSQQKETGFNLSIFFNKKMDTDLEDGRKTTNNEQRATDYFDFQNILVDEIPAIFLYQHQYLYVHPKNLRGLDTAQLVSGDDRFGQIDRWYMKTWPSWVAADSRSERK